MNDLGGMNFIDRAEMRVRRRGSDFSELCWFYVFIPRGGVRLLNI